MDKKKAKFGYRNVRGFSLIELMVATAILIIVLAGYLQLSIYCFSLTETVRNTTLAFSEAQGKIEEIRNHNFDEIVSDYSGTSFNLSQLTGRGVIYIDNTNPELLQVEVVISWREKGNRVIGEDRNLDGDLDAGEDADGNGKLDSPASVLTLIARR